MEAETTAEFRRMQRHFEKMFEHQRITQTNNSILHDKLNRLIGYNDTLIEVVKNMNGLVHTTAVATNASMNAMAKFTEDMEKYMADTSVEVRGTSQMVYHM